MNINARLLSVWGGAVLATVAVGCSSHQPAPNASTSAATPTGQPASPVAMSAAGCKASDVPLTILDSKAAGEPTLELPTPAGWEYSASMNSPIIRGLVANNGLRANGFTPNTVVTLEDLTGKVDNPEQAIDAEIASAAQNGVTIASRTPGTVCGHPSATITYTLRGHAVTALVTAAADGQKLGFTPFGRHRLSGLVGRCDELSFEGYRTDHAQTAVSA